MLSDIPVLAPATPLLDTIDQGASLRELKGEQLLQLADELRAFLLYSVGQSGGHFGAGLGVVELTVALHHVFHTPHDRIVWDVGHQTYPHKILTGRMGQMRNMRQAGGLSGRSSTSSRLAGSGRLFSFVPEAACARAGVP